MIENYRFGHVEIAGQEYTSDVIVHGDLIESWWRVSGHIVARDDIEALVAKRPAALVVGTGAMGLMRVPKETRQFIEGNGIALIVERTANAVGQFNRLCAEGKDVAIAMHLTC